MNNNQNPQQNQNDNNLLSFLKNQSLFNGSPTRRMSSRSRDRKSDRNRSPGANQYQGNTTYTTTYNAGAPTSFNDNNRVVNTSYQTSTGLQGGVQGNVNINGGNLQSSSYQGGAVQGGNYQGSNLQGGNLQGGNYTTTTYGNGGNMANIQGGNIRTSYETNVQSSNNMVQTGALSSTLTINNEKSYSSSFESARAETAARLDSLASKVQAEINNLNYKLEMFNS